MKKIILLTAALSLGIFATSFGQTLPEVDKLYNSYSSGEGVLALTLNKEMLDAVDMNFDWNEQMKHMTGDIYQIKFITFTEGSQSSKKVKELSSALSKLSLKEINLPEDKAETDLRYAKIYGDKHGQYYHNVIMLLLTEDNTGLFVAVNGKLKVEKQ